MTQLGISAPAALPPAGALPDAFVSHLHEGIISASSFDAVRALASRFPELCGMGIELHLGVPVQRTDFLLRVKRPEAQRMVARDECGHALTRPQWSPKWNPMRKFLHTWADPAPEALASVENVWLEFDIGSAFAIDSAPSIFFDVDRTGYRTMDQKMATVSSALATLGHEADPAIFAHFRRCAELAEPELRLYFVGLMLSRNSEAIRVCLLARSASVIVPYLVRTGWRGNQERLSALLARYRNGADRFVLNLDLSARTHDAVGVEIFQSSNKSWEPFFSLLERDGLCRPDETLAILKWPGKTRLADNPEERRLGTIRSRSVPSLMRRINHVKLSYDPSGEARAKAYLYFCQT